MVLIVYPLDGAPTMEQIARVCERTSCTVLERLDCGVDPTGEFYLGRCADSADFNLVGMNLPTVRWNSPLYAHTNDTLLFGATLFSPQCNALNFTPLYTPAAQSDLIQELKTFINAQ